MRLNFKKVSAIAASALMVGMTMGVAAAANYPSPFVVSGNADVAIVYGTGAGVSSLDLVQAGNIQSNLQSFMTGGTTSTTGSVSGEASPLFTGGTKLYLNDPLNTVKTVITKSDLPTVLADEEFSGNVDATIQQTISIGSNPTLTFAQQPTSSDDPQYGLALSTTSSNYLVNLTATFNKAVAFNSSDSEGQTLHLFGTDFTVSSATDGTNLVLLKSAQKIDLTRDVSSATATSPNAQTTVTVGGQTYTVELISGTSTASTVKVTDSTGASQTETVNEASSKKIQGITIAVTSASQAGNVVTASIVAGADKITLANGQAVETGDNNDVVQGTKVTFGGTPAALTSITISDYAVDSDHDAILPGSSYVDPAFGTVQVNFAGVNVPADSSARETIAVTGAGDDKLQVAFKDYNGNPISTVFAKNQSGGVVGLVHDDDGHNISVLEGQKLHEGDYVVVGNENSGYLLKVQSIQNTSSNTDVKFVDESTGSTLSSTFVAGAPTGTVTVGGKSYSLTIQVGDSGSVQSQNKNVTINYPDSTSNNVILYPTIQTSNGAKLAFWSPVTINDLSEYDSITTAANVTGLMFPVGNGQYTTATVVAPNDLATNYTWIVNGVALYTNGTTNSVTVNSGEFNYNVSTFGTNNAIKVFPVQPGVGPITYPAIQVIEGKDDNNNYNGMVITTEASGSKIGVSSSTTGVADTYSNGSAITLHSNNKLTEKADLWGSIAKIDSSDSEQYTATISYPSEEVYAQVYVGAASAVVTAGGVTSTAGAQLGDVLVKDSEVSGVSAKNLIVVGGSCINSVAANLLGSAACSADFTTSTGVGSGQFLIQSFASPYSTGKVALLVAGYEAADTVNAATYLRNQVVDTTVGKKYQGTSATTATLVTTSTTTSTTSA